MLKITTFRLLPAIAVAVWVSLEMVSTFHTEKINTFLTTLNAGQDTAKTK